MCILSDHEFLGEYVKTIDSEAMLRAGMLRRDVVCNMLGEICSVDESYVRTVLRSGPFRTVKGILVYEDLLVKPENWKRNHLFDPKIMPFLATFVEWHRMRTNVPRRQHRPQFSLDDVVAFYKGYKANDKGILELRPQEYSAKRTKVIPTLHLLNGGGIVTPLFSVA